MTTMRLRLGSALLVLGGVAVVLGGLTASRGVVLVGVACLGLGADDLRRRRGVPASLQLLLVVTTVLAWMAVVATGFGLAAGPVVQMTWALCLGAVAVSGSITRLIGDPIAGGLGLVGAGAFALASASGAWSERFDALCPLVAMLGAWAVLVGWQGLENSRGRIRVRVVESAGRRS